MYPFQAYCHQVGSEAQNNANGLIGSKRGLSCARAKVGPRT